MQEASDEHDFGPPVEPIDPIWADWLDLGVSG